MQPTAPALTGAARPGGFASRLRAASARALRVIGGTNPWPATGPLGHAAVLVMLAAGLTYLTAGVARELWGPPLERYFGNDLVAYLTAAGLLLRGEAQRLYDPAAQLAMQQALMASVGAEARGMEYVNPPLWAAVVALLFPLGVPAADFLWRILTLGVSAYLLQAVVRAAGLSWSWRASTLLLAFFPFLQAWHHRSMVAVLMVAFGGWMMLARQGRPRRAGLVLSLLCLKPQNLPFVLLYLAWKRQWQQLLGFAVGALIQGVLTVLLLLTGGGIPTLAALLAFLDFGGGATGSVVEAHVTLRALVLRALPAAGLSTQLGVLALATVLVTGALLFGLGRRWPTTKCFPPESARCFQSLAGREASHSCCSTHPLPLPPAGGGRRTIYQDAFSRAYYWEMLVVAAAANVTTYYSHLTGLVLLLPPAAVLLAGAAEHSAAGARWSVRLWLDQHRQTLLALGLAAPSLGILFLSLGSGLYVLGGWVAAVGALGLGLTVRRPLAGPPRHPNASR